VSPVKPYQQIGIDFLAAHSRAFLGDDAGLGKSMQMIYAANKLKLDRILIIAPAIARISWKIQLEEWDTQKRPIVLYPRQPLPPADQPAAVIVGYEWLSDARRVENFRAAMDGYRFDAVFLDEGHALKTPTAMRTKNIYGPQLNLFNGVIEAISFRWVATATPTPLGHVGELYSHLRALFPDMLADLFGGQIPNQFQFENHFCNVHDGLFGRVVQGNNPDTIPALKAALAPYFLMRRKADVLAELPPILTVDLPLDTGFAHGAEALAEADVSELSDEQVVALLGRQDRPEGTAPALSIKQELGLAKAEAALPWIDTFLRDNPDAKLLIFAHHRAVLERLVEACAPYDPVLVYGGTTLADKTLAVERFQTDPSARVFLGQNTAAGVAITLTAAHTVLLLEPHPSPDINYQIISRAHRLGQTEPVTAVIAFDHALPIERRHAAILRRRARDNKEMFGVDTPGVLQLKNNS
jgi:SWI/SNF-related matrix-associated actin-dependent regulator of chromatin subfamily A-like protein 1